MLIGIAVLGTINCQKLAINDALFITLIFSYRYLFVIAFSYGHWVKAALIAPDIVNVSCSRYSFALRIVLLLVVAWMSLLIFNSVLIVVPISLGRALFNAIPLLPITHGIKCNGNVVD